MLSENTIFAAAVDKISAVQVCGWNKLEAATIGSKSWHVREMFQRRDHGKTLAEGKLPIAAPFSTASQLIALFIQNNYYFNLFLVLLHL